MTALKRAARSACAAVLGLASTQASAVLVGFDPGDLALFTENGGGHAIAAGVGAGGSSGLTKATSFGGTSLVFNTPFANVAGATFSTAIMYRNTQTGSSGPDVRLGFASGPMELFISGSTENFYVETCCGAPDGSSTDHFKFGPKLGPTALGDEFFGTVGTVLDDWYGLTLELTNVDGAGAYSGVSHLHHFGPTGTEPGALISTGVFGFTSAAFAAHSDLYAGFTGHSAVNAYDNFVAEAPSVPEPGVLMMVGLGLAALGVSRRRAR